MAFNATFNNIFSYILYQPTKTTDMSQITVKLFHIILYPVHLVMNMILTRNFSGDSHWLHR